MFQRRYLILLLPAVLLMASCGGLKIGISVDSKPIEQQLVPPEVKPPCDPEDGCCPAREVLFFTSRGCPACGEVQPKVRAIRRQGVKVTELDYHENPELVSKYGITKTPTFIVLEDGVEIERTSSITALILILVKLLAIVLPLLFG